MYIHFPNVIGGKLEFSGNISGPGIATAMAATDSALNRN